MAPDWPATLQSILTSTAIVVGGGWAIWKWGYSEGLRKRREVPDLDGTLSVSTVPLSAAKAYLTLQALAEPGPGAPSPSGLSRSVWPGDGCVTGMSGSGWSSGQASGASCGRASE